MTGNTEPRGGQPRGRNDSGSGGTRRVLAIVPPPTDAEVVAEQQRAAWRAELAAREAALGVIRQHLESQPSAHLVRACGRRWTQEIRFAADAIAKAMSSTEAEQ